MTEPAAPVHVLMTVDCIGGVWTYALDLARATLPLGCRYTMVALGPGPTQQQSREVVALPNVTLLRAPFRLEWMPDPWEDVDAAGEWLESLARVEAPDVVHLNGYSLAARRFRAPVLVTAHSCSLSWWRAVKGEPAPSRWDEYRRRVHAGLRAAAVVVTPTCAMGRSLEQEHGALASRRTIPNGRAAPGPLPTGEREPLIAAVGRVWDEGKNLAAVARAAPRLPWRCVIAGDTASPDGRRVTLSDVTLTGRLSRSRLDHLLSRAALFLHPARYEPFGLAPLEAALAGCPLVLGDIPSLREVWEDAAVYVPPDDEEALVATVRRLAADAPARRLLAARAGDRARRYDLATFGAAYAQLYRRLGCRSAAAARPAVAGG